MSGYSLGPDWTVDPAYGVTDFISAAGYSIVEQRRRNDRGKHCKGANDTCKGYKSKGTEFCAGHLRSMGLLTEKKPDSE